MVRTGFKKLFGAKTVRARLQPLRHCLTASLARYNAFLKPVLVHHKFRGEGDRSLTVAALMAVADCKTLAEPGRRYSNSAGWYFFSTALFLFLPRAPQGPTVSSRRF